MRARLVVLVCVMLSTLAGLGKAQAKAEPRFSADRLISPAGGQGLVACESARIDGHRRILIHLLSSSAWRPVVLSMQETATRAVVIEPVSRVLSFHLSGAVELWRRLRMGLALPINALSGDRMRTVTGEDDFSPVSVGDLRLLATASLWPWQKNGSLVSVALSMELHLPTGDEDSFAGLGSVGIRPQLVLHLQPMDTLQFMAQVGVALYEQREFFGSTWGRRLVWAGGVSLALPWIPGVGRHLFVLAEADGESCNNCLADPPLEVRGGLRALWRRWRATVATGPGLGDGVTVPSWRLVVSLGAELY